MKRAQRKLVPSKAKKKQAVPPSPKERERSKLVASQIALYRAMVKKGSGKGIHPFILSNHPKSVFPPGASTMAQDDAINGSLNWAAAQWASSAASIWDEGLTFLGYPYLAQVTQRPEYRRPSEIIATEMTRKWIKLKSVSKDDKGKSEKIKAIQDELDRLQARDKFKMVAQDDGFFGRSHLYIDLGNTDDREELKSSIGNGRNEASKQKVPKGSLKRLQVVEPIWSYPANYNANNPLMANWYKPQMWYCQGQEVHASRLLTFVGREVPDLLKPAYSFGGLSLSQMMKPYIDNWIRTRQSVSDLVHSFSTSGLKTDLSVLMQGQGEDLFTRIDMFNACRDNRGAMVIDKENEEWFNVSVPLGSLDKLQAQAQEQMSAPNGIPLIKLFGITPSGLNATAEPELRVFYDWVHAFQESSWRVQLTKVIDFVQMSLYGEIDQDITFDFELLWTLDDKAESDKRKVEADTDVVLIGAGVLAPIESRKRIAADPDSGYNDLDVEDLPLPPEGEEDDGENLDKDDAETADKPAPDKPAKS